jgi:predicted nucleotidyltransferase
MLQLEKYKTGLIELCQENKAVSKLYLFGSALSPRFDEALSDVDVLVEASDLLPEERGENLITLWDNLEHLFNRKVDLLTENSLRNPFFKKEIEQTKKLIYDRQSQKIFI